MKVGCNVIIRKALVKIVLLLRLDWGCCFGKEALLDGQACLLLQVRRLYPVDARLELKRVKALGGQ